MTTIAGYSENDMYYASAECATAEIGTPLKTSCERNKTASLTIVENKNQIESAKEKYENMKELYGRELLHFFNMTIGISGLLYYVYKNQDAVQNFFI